MEFGRSAAPLMPGITPCLVDLRPVFRSSTWICAALACVILVITVLPGFAAAPRHILMLHAFNHPYSPWSDIAASFRTELSNTFLEPIDLNEVSIDTTRLGPEEEAPFVEYLRALLSRRRLDLVVPVGAPAAFFMERHRKELFAQAPMLIIGADQRRIPASTLTDKDTAVLLDLDLAAQLENILRLRPDTTNVAVIIGNSPVERFWTSELRRAFEPFADRVKIEWLNDLKFNEMLARAASMPPQSAILWIIVSEDAAGIPHLQERALKALHEVATAPVFGVGDYDLGRGIVGGPLVQTQAAGREAAEVASRILKGDAPASIKPTPIPFGPPMYDWRELQRWGISEALLPPDSIVQFREPPAWRRYFWQVAAIAAVVLGQSLLIAYVLFQSRRRQAAEAEAAEQRQEVMHLMRVNTLGELSGAIAHELNQPLTAILSNAQAALQLLAEKSPDLAELRDTVNDIIHEENRAGDVILRVRNLLRKGEHRFERVDINELIESTIALLNSEFINRRIGIATDLANALPATWGDPVQLQQVLLNLLMNAMDAMTATPDAKRRIKISTRVDQRGPVVVHVRDHGTGIKTEAKSQLFKPFYTSKDHGLGLGLAICSTIAQEHGGQLTLSNHMAGGAVATLTLPQHEFLMAAK